VHRTGVWTFVLRLFYRLLYNKFVWAYDVIAWLVSFGQWNSWTYAAIPYLGNGKRRILELAQGPGHLVVEISRRGLHPVGIDLSPYMCRRALRTLRRHNIQAPIIRARAQALPFCDHSFDCSVATFPTEFILDQETLREVGRVVCEPLRQHGRGSWHLVIVGWVRFGANRLVPRFLDWLYTVTGQGEPAPGFGLDILARAGFESQITASRIGYNDVMLMLATQANTRAPGTAAQ